jgi:phosphotriesterase-related protein
MAVTTVTGSIAAEDLGITAPHEHIFINMEVFYEEPQEIGQKQIAQQPVRMENLGILKRNPFALKDNVQMLDPQVQEKEIMFFKRAGGRTVVDASTVGLGRDPVLLRNIAYATGMNIIAGAGFYVDGAQSKQTLQMSIEEMEFQIVREIEEGVGHTGIRAGVIGEIGISYEMTDFEKRSLTAACRAQKKTGAPLMIHINPWSQEGIPAMKIVGKENIDPQKVVICHCDVENNREYIDSILKTGVFLEFDNFGKEMFTDRWDVKPGSGRFVTDWERVVLVKQLLDEGYEDQLLFSTDICLKSLLHTYGGWGYDHVLTHILPMLDEVGATDGQMRKILIANPRRWLDF